MNKDIKFVLFDFDDTLVNTIGPKWEQHKHVARVHYGKELTDAEISRHWGKPFREYLSLVFGTTDIDKAVSNNALYEADFPKTLVSSTMDTLYRLKAENKYTGIVTASGRNNLERDLVLAGVPEHLLDYIQTEEDTIFHKPDGRVFELVHALIGQLGVLPHEVLYVGDSLHDYRAASEAGFEFVGVETGLVKADSFRVVGADSVPSVAHLLGRSVVPLQVQARPN